MTVFKTFWKIVKHYKGTVILYTMMLIAFGGMNTTANNQVTTFTNTTPDILIVNEDTPKGLTKNLITYLENNTNIVKIKDNEEARDDALFYRDVNYIIYIPSGYRDSILKRIPQEINIKSTKDYDSSLVEMMLTRYLKVQDIYSKNTHNEEELISNINQSLKEKSKITMTTKLDTNTLTKSSRFFNFASYSIMAVIIYILSLVLTSFNELTIKKRTIISKMNYKEHNRKIILASFIYSLIIWILYVALGVILLGKVMFTVRGLIYILNTLVFSFCALTIALLISTIINNKNAINGIVNIVALSQAFLCGAFIPTKWLPDSVLSFARIFPAYWFNNTNDLVSTIEVLNLKAITPILLNTLILVVFSVIFIILNNLISKNKQKVG